MKAVFEIQDGGGDYHIRTLRHIGELLPEDEGQLLASNLLGSRKTHFCGPLHNVVFEVDHTHTHARTHARTHTHERK